MDNISSKYQVPSTKFQKLAIIATGSSGLVASKLEQKCLEKGIPFFGIDLSDEVSPTNILETESLNKRITEIQNQIKGLQPVLFHFAAAVLTGNNLTAEQVDFTWKLNTKGTKNVVDVCQQFFIPLIHISTDFVFSGGKKTEAYLPTDTPISDNTPYVDSKIKAEEAVLSVKNSLPITVIRLAFPYGNSNHPRASKGDLMVKILSWIDQKEEVKLYSDQHICPTPLEYFSNGCLVAARKLVGKTLASGSILHIVGKPTTPYDFGMLIHTVFDKKTALIPSSIKDTGIQNLVLDTTETEKMLEIIIPKHEVEVEKLAGLMKKI